MKLQSLRLRGLAIVLVLASITVTACGTVFGSMGASDQAAKDLAPIDSAAAQRTATRKATDRVAQRAEHSCLINDQQGISASAECLASLGGATGWVWVSETGQLATEPGKSEYGGWYWVSALGQVTTAAEGPGRWFWVSDQGDVSDVRSSISGAWYWLESPTQASRVQVIGSTRVTTPGADPSSGGWYWSPPSGSNTSPAPTTAGPVTGGAGPSPVAPRPLEPSTSVTDPNAVAPLLSVDACNDTPPTGGFSSTPNGAASNGVCSAPFLWSTVGSSPGDQPGQLTITGVVVVDPRSTPEGVAAVISATLRSGSNPVITSIRTGTDAPINATSTDVSRAGSGCPDGGVQIGFDKQDDRSSVSWRRSLTICDHSLTALLYPTS